MSLFDIKRIKWYKYMENTIENVKVSNISFVSGNTVRLEFLNAVDNKFRGTIVCSGILKYNMEYGGEEAALPYLVWDVRVKGLSEDEIKDALKYFRYGFDRKLDDILARQYSLLSIIGKDICIDILCENVDVIYK